MVEEEAEEGPGVWGLMFDAEGVAGEVDVELEGTMEGMVAEDADVEGCGCLGLEILSWARRSWRRSFSSLSSRNVFNLYNKIINDEHIQKK